MNKEIWKPIPNYEGFYEISNLGRVKRLHTVVTRKDGRKCTFPESICKNQKNKGYPSLRLSKNGITKGFLVHRLVATAFIPNPLNKPCINHINGNKEDLSIENLEWCTKAENNSHAFATGLNVNKDPYKMKGKFGSAHHNAKAIFQFSLQGVLIKKWDSIADAANFLGAKRSNISKCAAGKANSTRGYKWSFNL